MDVLALVISAMAFVLSLWQFFRSSLREKNESTLDAYNELQNDVFSYLNSYKLPISEVEYLGEEWEKITIYLAKIERFSVGINTGIYSLDILNHLGGAYYIRLFEKLQPIIQRKREENVSPGEHYDEFEKTVLNLIKYREKSDVRRFLFNILRF